MEKRYARLMILSSTLLLVLCLGFEGVSASKEDEIEALKQSILDDQAVIDLYKKQQETLGTGGLPDVWLNTETPRLVNAIAGLTKLIGDKQKGIKKREDEKTGQFYNGVIKSLSSFEEPAFSKAITDLTNFFKENEVLMSRLTNEIANRRILDFFKRAHQTFMESQERGKTKPYQKQKEKMIAFFVDSRPKISSGKESRKQFGFRELSSTNDLKQFDQWLQEIKDAQTIEKTAQAAEQEPEEEEAPVRKGAARERAGKGAAASKAGAKNVVSKKAVQEEPSRGRPSTENISFKDYKKALSSFKNEDYGDKARTLKTSFKDGTPIKKQPSEKWIDVLKPIATLFTQAMKRGPKPNQSQKDLSKNLFDVVLTILRDEEDERNTTFGFDTISQTDQNTLQECYDGPMQEVETAD